MPRSKIAPFLLSLVPFLRISNAQTDYSFSEYEGDTNCTTRSTPFNGFGALETRQCSPVLAGFRHEGPQGNQTETFLGEMYFELDSVSNHDGSSTQAQVPVECLQNGLPEISSHIISAAVNSNPPINPYPLSTRGNICRIVVPDMIMSTGSGKDRREYSPDRHINFVAYGLNPAICNAIIDYLDSRTRDCQNESRVRQLDAGKAFLVIGLMLGSAGVIAAGIYCIRNRQSVKNSISGFFARPNSSNALPATAPNPESKTTFQAH